MHLFKHERSSCPNCGASIGYGVKEEPSCWKLVVQCLPRDGCGFDLGSRRIPLGDVEHRDEVAARAEELAAELGR